MRDRKWLIGSWVWVSLFVLGGIGFFVAVERTPPLAHYEYAGEGLVFAIAMTALGSVILVPRPRQPIGLVLLFAGVASATQFGAGEYAVLAVHEGWPLGAAAAWLATVVRTPGFVLSFALLLMLYPSGRPLGKLGRVFVVVAVASALATGARLAFIPGPLEDLPTVANPVGLEFLRPAFPILEVIEGLGTGVSFFGGVLILGIRYRRSLGFERLQIRWVFFAAGAALFVLLALNLVLPVQMENDLGHVVWTLAPLSVPAAMALAVVRYRLYEIDRIISRTVSYGLVSAVLIGVYLVSVFLLGTLRPLEGEAAVAGSTLLAAALFNPLRRRIQNAVDRRFNRSRFDTERIMEALSRRLSSEVDLLELGRELQVVAHQTMHPTTVAVWLREA